MRIDGHEIYGSNSSKAYLYDSIINGIDSYGIEDMMEMFGTAIQQYAYDLEVQIRKKLEKEITEAHQAKADAEQMVKSMQSVLDGMKK